MEDTINLLKECDAGTKMAVASIDEVLEHAKGKSMIDILEKEKQIHESYGNIIHEYLLDKESEGKEPNPLAKGMAWMKTNMKMTFDDGDSAIADIMTDGCNMGIESLKQYVYKYPDAEDKAKKIAYDLIEEERNMINYLKGFL